MDNLENEEIVPIEEQIVESSEDSGISFEDLGLDEITLKAVEKKGFKTPSPIQALAIPRLLSGEANMIARARTGTGKTAAFGLPIMQELRGTRGQVKALILEPTRELAIQTCNEMQSFADGKGPYSCVLYGGASYSTQIKDLRRGCEIVVGTPGRVQDHLERGTLDISKIDYFILDEGDEMLDMGFIDDIEAIFQQANPDARILLFSATMPAPILKIAGEFMGDYEIVEEEGVIDEPLLIDQKFWILSQNEKIDALVRLIDIADDFYGLVFTQTKSDADYVSKALDEKGYEVAALHGDIPQSQREKILARFRIKKTRVLVATDVAARGIDITGLSHVVNFSLPFDAATYVHRIGRTGRAGSTGIAVTFVCANETRKLSFLQKSVKRASKGEMKEEQIPSIDEVLEKKRSRIFQELKAKLGLNEIPVPEKKTKSEAKHEKLDSEKEAENTEATDKTISETQNLTEEQNETSETEQESKPLGESDGEIQTVTNVTDTETEEHFFKEMERVDTINSNSTLIKVSPDFEKMAGELCKNNDSQDVLAAVLSVMYASKLNRDRYGRIRSGGSKSDQTRLYVQLGKKDGYNAKALADYFSKLLHISGQQVDRIDVSSTFSLVSLPKEAAKRALDMSRDDGRVPHMHVDTKDGDFSKSRSRRDDRDDFGGRRRGGFGRGERGFGERSRGGRDFGGRRRFEDNDRGFRSKGRPNVHTPTERTGSSSGLSRKKSRKAERF